MVEISDILKQCPLPPGEMTDDGPMAVLITDTNLDPPGPTILYAGGDIEVLTGYRPDELVGKTPRVLQGSDSDKQVLKRLRDCLAKGEYFEGYTINYRKDGTPMVMVWAVCPVFGENHEVLYFFSIHTDGTDGAVQTRLAHIGDRLASMRCALDRAGVNLTKSVATIGRLLQQVVACHGDDCDD